MMESQGMDPQGMEVLASSDSYVLECSSQHGLGRLTFRKKPSAMEYQAAISHFCDQVLKRGFRLMLFNNLEAGLISQDEKDWSRFYIENLLPNCSLRKMASVVGGNALQRMIISDMHQQGKHPYRLECFASEQEALAWLLA
ncbi:hypothetical protein [Rufibacter latericius]|uniref:STAS/SEC14 domain-containing protein n=1 Tax=Rufibacter latericius TaxID=2487040 RepID=A0A3M9MEZ9_9BACT|nr:hypothetical protein [Rufibacter latericius]RNI24141.1 hypothetical protein EFB08_17360 [Rufibacter latericius]